MRRQHEFYDYHFDYSRQSQQQLPRGSMRCRHQFADAARRLFAGRLCAVMLIGIINIRITFAAQACHVMY